MRLRLIRVSSVSLSATGRRVAFIVVHTYTHTNACFVFPLWCSLAPVCLLCLVCVVSLMQSISAPLHIPPGHTNETHTHRILCCGLGHHIAPRSCMACMHARSCKHSWVQSVAWHVWMQALAWHVWMQALAWHVWVQSVAWHSWARSTRSNHARHAIEEGTQTCLQGRGRNIHVMQERAPVTAIPI